MVLDMNIALEGIDEDFLEELEELIEDTRVEYFIINPTTKEELEKTQNICNEYERFKYTLPIEFKDKKDNNCMALRITESSELVLVNNMPVVKHSENPNETFNDI